MNIFFVEKNISSLACEDNFLIAALQEILTEKYNLNKVKNPELADVILVHEENSFKTWRYIDELQEDKIIGQYPHKTYTINTDDCATGLLKGIYTSITKNRYNSKLHKVAPYYNYPNKYIEPETKHNVLTRDKGKIATWRGNTKSNKKLRCKIIETFSKDSDFVLETTDSWLNHNDQEQLHYKELMVKGKFSLCPAGWAPVSFRIYESMMLGIAPVIISNQYVYPNGPDWSNCSIRVSEREVKNLKNILKIHENNFKQIGLNALNEWNEFFNGEKMIEYYAKELVDCFESNLNNISREMEISRWRSKEMYFSNGWTFPQRVINKISKIRHSIIDV